jgi:hypothetical protein
MTEIPSNCPWCAQPYGFLVEPRPTVQPAAKFTIGVGSLATLACVWMALHVPLPQGVREISAWTVLAYAVPAALLPIATTIAVASRFKHVLRLKCRHCGRVETVYCS